MKLSADTLKHLFPKTCKENGIPMPVDELRFAPPRKFRFDYAWPEYKLALEVEGGVYIQGRHTRGSGFVKDKEKYNIATKLGWRLLRCTPQQLNTPEMLDTIKQCLNTEEQDAA